MLRQPPGKVTPLWSSDARLCRTPCNVLIVAKERIYIVGLSQNVPAPAIQNCNLQEGCQVFRLVA